MRGDDLAWLAPPLCSVTGATVAGAAPAGADLGPEALRSKLGLARRPREARSPSAGPVPTASPRTASLATASESDWQL